MENDPEQMFIEELATIKDLKKELKELKTTMRQSQNNFEYRCLNCNKLCQDLK